MDEEFPASVADMVVMDATNDVEKIAEKVDFVFCAVDMKKDEIKALEERYAKAECPVVSNNSAHRHTPDLPMIISTLKLFLLSVKDLVQREVLSQLSQIALYNHICLQWLLLI